MNNSTCISLNEVISNLDLSQEQKAEIAFEESLIKTFVEAREKSALSQRDLGRISQVKQPTIAKIEKLTHSPQINTLLKLLIPMGYTLNIVPISNKLANS